MSLTIDGPLVVDGVEGNLAGFVIVGCYDGAALELLDAQAYSEFYDTFAFLSYFSSSPEQANFWLAGSVKKGVAGTLFAYGTSLPLFTLYFRVRGEPNTTTELRFCDNVISGRSCAFNQLDYDFPGKSLEVKSPKHTSGVVRILSGEPTHPQPPPLPENANVYPEAPTKETAKIHFELEGPAVTHPGATHVPFDLFVTSNYEFSGFMTSLSFPAQYLELTSVDEHTRPGLLSTDNAAGGFGLLMSNSRRRVGSEGECVHLATLYFNVKDAARETSALTLAFGQYGNFFNWLAIQHRQGLTTEDLPITAEVSPLLLTEALLAVQSQPTPIGDVNFDYQLNISDALSLLGYLFLGGEVVCLPAADFNQDNQVNISDGIAILSALFLDLQLPPGMVTCE